MSERLQTLKAVGDKPVEDWMANFSQRALAAIRPLEIYTENLAVSELIERSRSIPDMLKDLNKPAGTTKSTIEHCLREITPGETRQYYEDMIAEIDTETTYLNELEETQISPAIRLGDIKGGRFRSLVIWFSPESFVYDSLKKQKIKGFFLPFLDITGMRGNLPSLESIWAALATDGSLPEKIATLDHELTHDLQFPRFWLSYWLDRDLGADSMLSEVHAYAAEAATPSSWNLAMDEAGEVANHVIGAYKFDKNLLKPAEQAFNQLQALRMLGLDDEELGQIVHKAEFSNGGYPLLVETIQDKLGNELRIPSSIWLKYLSGLKTLHNVSLHHARWEATTIATKHLTKWIGIRTSGSIRRYGQ